MVISATYAMDGFAHDWLKHELDPEFTRRTVTLLSGAGSLKTGSVLGRITKGAATSAAKSGGNTGNGTLTLDVTTPVLAAAKPGIYTVRCIAAATNSGTFRVEGPDGLVLGDVAVGATWSEHIKFAIADGASDFIVGDGFDITVAAGSSKYALYNPTLLDGRETAAAILLNAVDATSADQKAVVVLCDAVINPLSLVWHASVDNQTKKDTGLAQLATLGIVTRQVV